ncbi:MAG: hypothetical protein QME61_03440 [Patescibacteria group bacterium]|nr:hypothetical protein [Patescibacteria group bacterium]
MKTEIGAEEIAKMSDNLGLSEESKNMALRIFREEAKNRNKKKVIAAILAIVCRQSREPRGFSEITKAIGLKKNTRGIKKIAYEIVRKFKINLPPLNPEDFVPRFCDALDLTNEVKEKTREIIREVTEKGLTNKKPTSIAATAIYIGAILNNKYRTQKEISEVTGISEVTIRNIYKEIREKLDIDFLLR